MKKLIAMILAAAMLLSLTACGSTAADAAADDPEAETASADASAETPSEKPRSTADGISCARRKSYKSRANCRAVLPVAMQQDQRLAAPLFPIK